MPNLQDMELNFNFADNSDEVVQEGYNPGSSSFSDLFDGKFSSFDPTAIVSGGNNHLKSGMFDMEIEESDLKIGYKNAGPGTDPKPGRWF